MQRMQAVLKEMSHKISRDHQVLLSYLSPLLFINNLNVERMRAHVS